MGYRLTEYAKTRKNLPGVPWRDLSAEEYAAACALHPGMETQGYFEKVEETPPPVVEVKPRARNDSKVTTAPPAEEEHADG